MSASVISPPWVVHGLFCFWLSLLLLFPAMLLNTGNVTWFLDSRSDRLEAILVPL